MPRLSYRYETLHNDENAKLFTYLLIIFNILYAILGAMMLAAGFFISFDEDFREYVKDLELQHYMVGVYILMTAGTLVMVQSFFGICGAYLKKSGMLKIFFVMILVCFVLEIAGASYLLANGTEGSNLDPFLQNRFYDLIAQYTYDTNSKRTIDIIQEYVGCCGAAGLADYVRWNMVVPTSCYDPITGNVWYKEGEGFVGCVEGFSAQVERGTGWICGIALFLAFFQIFGMMWACCLMSIKKDFRKKSLGDLTER